MTERVLDVLELRQQLDESGIRDLVAAFYERVRDDRLLAPVFAARIEDETWPLHLDTMQRFWSTTLLGSNRYEGDPLRSHRTLPGLTHAHFDRWLDLFHEVAREQLPRRVADAVAKRAERMGQRLRLAALATQTTPA